MSTQFDGYSRVYMSVWKWSCHVFIFVFVAWGVDMLWQFVPCWSPAGGRVSDLATLSRRFPNWQRSVSRFHRWVKNCLEKWLRSINSPASRASTVHEKSVFNLCPAGGRKEDLATFQSHLPNWQRSTFNFVAIDGKRWSKMERNGYDLGTLGQIILPKRMKSPSSICVLLEVTKEIWQPFRALFQTGNTPCPIS